MKCPKCHADLVSGARHKIKVLTCPSCHGMWFSPQDFEHLENEAFDLDEHAKGTLVFSSTVTDARCPVCGGPLRRFNYRLYDLELEFCDRGDGYWLDDGSDTKVLELMRTEERNIDRSMDAETRWGLLLTHMHSGGFIEKVRELFQ
jgi:Zn-finger nucleic acid-binding protein